MRYDKLIRAYETDVQDPEVSGMEHLDMLMTRSEIARCAIPHLRKPSCLLRIRIIVFSSLINSYVCFEL